MYVCMYVYIYIGLRANPLAARKLHVHNIGEEIGLHKRKGG